MKALNILLMVIGITLLGYGHLHWAIRRESPELKTAVNILWIVPGWALLTMGYVGLQCHPRRIGEHEP